MGERTPPEKVRMTRPEANSMEDWNPKGTLTATGDLEQQLKNAYSDLEKVLRHYGCTFDNVVVERVFTTDMAKFLEVSPYRSSIYTKNFPTGTWLLPEFMIEIELEAHGCSECPSRGDRLAFPSYEVRNVSRKTPIWRPQLI